MCHLCVTQGSGGAYEISSRMTALLGWGATTGYQDGWTWDQVRVLCSGLGFQRVQGLVMYDNQGVGEIEG